MRGIEGKKTSNPKGLGWGTLNHTSLGSERGPRGELSHTWRRGGEAHTGCRPRSGLYYLAGSHCSPDYCCRVRGRGSHPSRTPLSGVEESVLFIPLPQHTYHDHPQDPAGEDGRRALCSHLVAVSLTRTWLRREEQLNSNSSRKVT